MYDTLDFDRHRRQGFPKVIYGGGETVNEVLAAATRLVEAHGKVLVTRTTDEALPALTDALQQGRARWWWRAWTAHCRR